VSALLVDTHALLWWLTDDPALTPAARAAIDDPESEPFVSLASLWEIALKISTGKLAVEDDLPAIIAEEGFELLGVSVAHAWEVRSLPLHHRDPFDRLLIAQALVERLPVVTGDARFAAYGVDVRW
jgi:PIN domain nuclease of toxin-antitoxin system